MYDFDALEWLRNNHILSTLRTPMVRREVWEEIADESLKEAVYGMLGSFVTPSMSESGPWAEIIAAEFYEAAP